MGLSFLSYPGIKLYGSIKSRKVSSQSIHSDSKCFDGEPSSEDIESMTMFNEEAQEAATEDQQEAEDERIYQNMPWVKVILAFVVLQCLYIQKPDSTLKT